MKPDTALQQTQELSTYEAYADMPAFPPEIYSALPQALAYPCAYFAPEKQRAKDMFLLAAITAIGAALKETYVLINDEPSYMNILVLISAPPFSYKSAITGCKGYIRSVERHYKQRYESALIDWTMKLAAAKENKEPFNEPRPFEHWFSIPAKTNRPTLIKMLASCPINLQLAGEASTIFKGFSGGEYSDYRDILLAAWNSEELNEQTKSGGRTTIERPRLGLVTTTTPEQTYRLTGSGADGLLSRFLVYISADDMDFNNPFVSETFNGGIDNAYIRAMRYSEFILERSQWPQCEVRFTEAMQKDIVALVNETKRKWLAGNPDQESYRSISGRNGLMLTRIAAVLSVLEAPSHSPVIFVKPYIYEIAKAIATTLLEHIHRMVIIETSRAPKEAVIPKPVLTDETNYEKFQRMLPKRSFTRTEAHNIGAELSLPAGSIDGYLGRMRKKGVLKLENRLFSYV